MIPELLCKIFGHQPAYIRANYDEMKDVPIVDRTYEVELGCARCMSSLDDDEYDSDELARKAAENHKRLGK